MKTIARPGLMAAMLWAGACQAPIDPEADAGLCPQTYEFGNYGCARILAFVDGPPQPWPARYVWDVRAAPVRESTGASVAFAPMPDTGTIPLQLTRWAPPAAGSGDTASVWVHARLLEDPQPRKTGVPLPVFAAESVRIVVRFAPVGERAPVDTVRLTLKRR